MKTNARLKKKGFVKIFLLSIMLFALWQCTVISFYPLYTEDELILDDRIIGTWMTKLIDEDVPKDSIVWEISLKNKDWYKKAENPLDSMAKKCNNPKTYQLKIYPFQNTADITEFDIHIVKLKDRLYLDFLLDDYETDSEMIFANFHLLPVHTFAQLKIIDNELIVKWFNGDFLEDLLESNKIRIRHEKRKEAIMLTAKPKELQKFIVKYASNPKAYNEDLSFNLSPFHIEN